MPHDFVLSAASIEALPHCDMCVFENAATKNVKWPRSDNQLRETQNAFKSKFKLPGSVGAIDSSVIRIKMPLPSLTGGESDCYWSFRGHCAIMLLAVVSADMLFIYANAGAPGNLGDAGLRVES
jgi:hypothetical protein